jgi:2-succinyl-6-hydroxy-2,4-cyclohexadiene-1-carboxylate synthase
VVLFGIKRYQGNSTTGHLLDMGRDRLYFTTDGPPRQPPLLLLHGFLGDSRDFAEVTTHLQTEFYCIRVDLPGHGQTQGISDYGMNHTANLILDVLSSLNLTQAHLMGYSMGGRLALYLALHFPWQFPRVIVESASPGLLTTAERSARRQQDAALADRLVADFPKFLNDWYRQPLFRSLPHHPDFASMQQRRWQNNPVELANSLRQMGLGTQPHLWDALAQHQAALLLLAGEGDRKFVAINQAMANCCAKARLQVISQAGHNIHLEQPLAWLAAIRQFLI